MNAPAAGALTHRRRLGRCTAIPTRLASRLCLLVLLCLLLLLC